MKYIRTIFLMACLISLSALSTFAQSAGDYRSVASANWSAVSTWQKYSGTAWAAATAIPTGDETITIQATDSVVVDVPVTISKKVISKSGKMGVTGSLTFATGSVYQHDADAGNVPVATWNTGSTCLLTGVVSKMPSNTNQNFYNLSWNCPTYGTSALNFGMGGNVISGDLHIIKGNSTPTAVRLTASNIGNTAPGANVITINGNIILDDATCSLTSTGSSGADTIAVYVKGDIVSSGVWNLANGSGAMCNWYVSGNVNLKAGTITTNSTASYPDSLVFVGTSTQIFYKDASIASAANCHFGVRAGAIVDMQSSQLGGSDKITFNLDAGATLKTAHTKGINGNLNNLGANTLSPEASYVYNGTAIQLDSLLPSVVKNLTIDNPTTVSFIRPVTVNGVLTLKQGMLDNSVNAITIGASGSVVFAGGNTKVAIPGWASVKEISIAAKEFRLFNNYPNPFNPSTKIRFSVATEGTASLKVMNILGQEVATLFEGNAKAGSLLEVTFDAKNLTSGVYFARLQQGGRTQIQKLNLMK